MHDPVDLSRDHTSSIGAAAHGELESAAAVTIAPEIQLDKLPAIGATTECHDATDARDDRDGSERTAKPGLVTPTMWR
ncbi:hypothetical protein [Bradyrhizobium sp. SRS-191]|uniref:hypothetical protein n=1 Tax=Bradyrhizobium sp. SRS-191 TaxID=2962606 RepID=UPI00211DFC70|nr:hypothetical protein [Bradyrhizobium sp. SRS-191]